MKLRTLFFALLTLSPWASPFVPTATAAPLATPLAATRDELGAQLQQTFISAPPEIATRTQGRFFVGMVGAGVYEGRVTPAP